MGKLFIVSTPIGNLDDITFRAIKTLKSVDLILCEDTRRTLKLLNHYEIKNKLLSYHSYNEKKNLNKIIDMINLENKNIALVTDNGTPTISDPGWILVNECYKNNIEVIPIPGASALTCSLSICGFSTDNFIFIGFLPRKEGKIKKILNNLKDFEGLIITYESPFRVKETLKIIREIFTKEKEIFIGRELTKVYEEKIRGKIDEVIEKLDKIEQLKGEFVLIINNY